jgi:Uma2 family endonuclease
MTDPTRRALNAKLTYDDYAAIPSNGLIYQITDGEVFVTPAPSPYHQRASKRLQRQLEAYFEASGRRLECPSKTPRSPSCPRRCQAMSSTRS